MRKPYVLLAFLMIASLMIAGCGDSDGETRSETPSTQTQTTAQSVSTVAASIAEAPSTTKTSADTEPPAPPSDSDTPGAGEWTTVMTLTSSDEPWQGLDGILVSEPFTASGEAQLVLDMPDAGTLDGVIVAIVPADKVTDVTSLLDAIQDAAILTLLPSAPTEAVNDLDGTYVLVNSIPGDTAWTLELQTR